jgi:hypothetical protein
VAFGIPDIALYAYKRPTENISWTAKGNYCPISQELLELGGFWQKSLQEAKSMHCVEDDMPASIYYNSPSCRTKAKQAEYN